MELTDKEKQVIAYMRAYEYNKTRRKMLTMGASFMLLLILDIIFLRSNIAGGIIGFSLILTASISGFFIRRPEKKIADGILKEG